MSYRYVYGDLLSIMDVDAICHQVNCLTVKPHGLSMKLAEKYPWADIYKLRKSIGNRNLASPESRGLPGTIRIFNHRTFPSVICLQAQWDYGRCDKSYQRNIPPHTDSEENRQKWFEQCLEEIGLTPYHKIAFPFKIGCGLAGSSWSVYNKILKKFSTTYRKEVLIIIPNSPVR